MELAWLLSRVAAQVGVEHVEREACCGYRVPQSRLPSVFDSGLPRDDEAGEDGRQNGAVLP